MPRILRAAAIVAVLFSLSASAPAWAHGDDWGGCDKFDVIVRAVARRAVL